MKTKICSKCGKNKSLDDFYTYKYMRDGYLNVCKRCSIKKSSDWWFNSKKRTSVFERDKYTCQTCGVKANEIHHKDETGSNRPTKEQNNKLNNLIALCHTCHMKLHHNRSKGKWKKEINRNKKIYNLSKKISQTEIAREYGITRQRVNQIIKNFSTNKKLDKIDLFLYN